MKLQEENQQRFTEQAENLRKKGLTFLEQNQKRPGVEVTTSGLQYFIEDKGKGKHPGPNDMVKLYYKGSLTTGELFDNISEQGKPISLQMAKKNARPFPRTISSCASGA